MIQGEISNPLDALHPYVIHLSTDSGGPRLEGVPSDIGEWCVQGPCLRVYKTFMRAENSQPGCRERRLSRFYGLLPCHFR